MAMLMNNSMLLKTYEQIIQTYEDDISKKNGLIGEMERDLHKISVENSNLAQQLYNLKMQLPLIGQNGEEG